VRQKGIQYVLINKVKYDKILHPEEHRILNFYRSLGKEAQLVKRFSPYRDKSIQWPFNRHPMTAGPFIWKELTTRERNGHILELYALPPP